MTIAPKLTIPTGYESEQRAIDRRRKIAEVLMQQGMQQNPHMTSPWQAIAQVVSAAMSKRADKKADTMRDALSERVRGDLDGKSAEFTNDAAMYRPEQLVAKWGNDPLMQERLKPYREAQTRALTEREQLRDFRGQVGVRTGDVMGQYEQGKPTDLVTRDPNTGAFVPNEVAINATARSQGFEGGEPQAPAGGGNPGTASNVLSMDQVKAAASALGAGGTSKWLSRHGFKIKVSTPDEARTLPSGTPIILPDGSEGRVP